MVWYRRIELYFVFTRDCLMFAAGSTMQSEVHGSAPHYLRSSKYPTARRRDFTCESANESYQCDDAYANNSIPRSQHLAVPTTSERLLENGNEISRRSKRKFSDSNEDEIEPFSASRLACCQHPCFSTPTSIPKRPRHIVSNSQVTDVSSVVQDDHNCARLMNNYAQCTYQKAFPERRDQEQVSCDVPDPTIIQPFLEEISVRQDGPSQQHESDDACGNRGNRGYPFESRFSIADCLGTEVTAERTKKTKTSSATIIFNSQCRGDPDVLLKTRVETFENSNGSVLQGSEAPVTQFGVDNEFLSNPEYGSGPSVFQFPYKKRPHNWSSFLAVAAPRCFDDQQPLPIEYSHPGYFMDLADRNELPCFQPFYYLQQLLTPQQVEQVTAQNPGTEWAWS